MPLITGDDLHEDGLISASSLAETSSPIELIEITALNHTTTYIDLKWIPRINLLTHIEGSSWIVDYYSQILNTDSNLSGQQYTKNAVYQSYKLVKGMEIKVSNPLSTSQDSESKGMTVTGTALLYPFIIPNEGDMFVADIGEGKRACFRITDSVKKSIFKEACYEISYGLSDDDNTGDISDLNHKVIQTFHFHKDFLTYGQNPLVISNDDDSILQLERLCKPFVAQYFKKFFSKEFSTLVVPAQETYVYDHFLVDYLLSILSVIDSHEIKHIRKLNVDDDDVMSSDNLWTALKRRDSNYIDIGFKESGLVDVRMFTKDAVLNGIRYTGIRNVVYPADPTLSVDYMQRDRTRLMNLDNIIGSDFDPTNNPFELTGLGTKAKLIYPVTKDKNYVLSSEFYNKTNNQSILEGFVWNWLENKEINVAQLVHLVKNYSKWGVVEQFYYFPIIITLLKSTIRGI